MVDTLGIGLGQLSLECQMGGERGLGREGGERGLGREGGERGLGREGGERGLGREGRERICEVEEDRRQ